MIESEVQTCRGRVQTECRHMYNYSSDREQTYVQLQSRQRTDICPVTVKTEDRHMSSYSQDKVQTYVQLHTAQSIWILQINISGKLGSIHMCRIDMIVRQLRNTN